MARSTRIHGINGDPIRGWLARALDIAVRHWRPWMVMQKGIVLSAIGLAYGVPWVIVLGVPFAALGGSAFAYRCLRSAAPTGDAVP